MFVILIEDRAVFDIKNTIQFYEKEKIGLGIKFKNELSKNFDAICLNPYYQIRYRNVRCKPLKKFPYLIHFIINKPEEIISVYAIVSTHRNPNFM